MGVSSGTAEPATGADAPSNAQEAAQRALAIDPDVADAHASLALGYLLWQFDWSSAEREFRHCG